MISFSETLAVFWVSRQLIETVLKLLPVSSEFVKITYLWGFWKKWPKFLHKKTLFYPKNWWKFKQFQKSPFRQKMSAHFHFWSRFFWFWNCKMSFFASEQITTRYVCFFRCKLPRIFRSGNPLLLCSGGETGTNNCPKWKFYNFALKLEQLLENLKIVLPLLHSFFDFSFLVSKKWVKELWNWSTFLKLARTLNINFTIEFTALDRVFRFWLTFRKEQIESASFCKNRLKAQFHT